MPRKSFEEVLKYTEYAMKTFSQKSMTEDEKKYFISQTRHNFNNHINPGFLEYRKSAGGDEMAMEWISHGDTFEDLNGKEYIDCLGGFGAFNCGHRHPKIVEAISNQLAKQPLSSAELVDANRSLLARILADVTPGDLKYTFFTSSGTESIECALKMATLATGRHYYVAFKGDFHGKSLGALSLTSKDHYRGPFLPLIQGVRHAPFGDIKYLEKLIETMEYVGELPAAIVFEPIQGEAGIIIPPDDFIPGIRKICDKYDIMMVADEVQTGMGRTGYMFAIDYNNVAPDILCLGKSISGSVIPLSATVCTERAFRGMFPDPLLHSTTTGGNPIATSAGIAAINVILSEDLCGKAQKGEKLFKEGMAKLRKKYPKLLRDFRGRGLLLAMEFCDGDKGYEVVYEAFNRGLLMSGSLINAKTIRIQPPLVISEENIKEAIAILDVCMGIVYEKHFNKRLKFSKESCIGCQLCAQACSAMHEGEFSLSKSRIGIESYYDKGKELKFNEAYCILCGICAKKCPEEAIKVGYELELVAGKCTGCGVCAAVCPQKVIKMLDKKPLLCDTCDGDPACVSICPHGALKYE